MHALPCFGFELLITLRFKSVRWTLTRTSEIKNLGAACVMFVCCGRGVEAQGQSHCVASCCYFSATPLAL